MVNLLAIWRAQGLDTILREAWEQGVVLAGLSAGSMCWFEWGVTTSSGAPQTAPGLGFLRVRTPCTTTASRPVVRSTTKPSAPEPFRRAGPSTTPPR